MLLPVGQPFQETWQFKVFLLGKLVQEILLSTHSLPRAIIKYWLPARWASGFSGDHQQNHQCFWFHSCYNVTHVSCPSLFVFCWEWKLLLLLIMLVELLSPCTHPTKDHSIEFRIWLNLSSIEFKEDWSNHKIFCPFQDSTAVLAWAKFLCDRIDVREDRYKQMDFNQIWNLIEITSLGQAPALKKSVAIRMKIFTTNYRPLGCFGCRLHGYIQCTLDITQSVFMEELTKDTSISPVKMRYGVSFVRAKSAQSLTPARDLFHRCGHS